MRVFKCDKLPNGLEFGGVVIASTEQEAKQKLKDFVEQRGWNVDIDAIHVVEVTDIAEVDPMNMF